LLNAIKAKNFVAIAVARDVNDGALNDVLLPHIHQNLSINKLSIFIFTTKKFECNKY